MPIRGCLRYNAAYFFCGSATFSCTVPPIPPFPVNCLPIAPSDENGPPIFSPTSAILPPLSNSFPTAPSLSNTLASSAASCALPPIEPCFVNSLPTAPSAAKGPPTFWAVPPTWRFVSAKEKNDYDVQNAPCHPIGILFLLNPCRHRTSSHLRVLQNMLVPRSMLRRLRRTRSNDRELADCVSQRDSGESCKRHVEQRFRWGCGKTFWLRRWLLICTNEQ